MENVREMSKMIMMLAEDAEKQMQKMKEDLVEDAVEWLRQLANDDAFWVTRRLGERVTIGFGITVDARIVNGKKEV